MSRVTFDAPTSVAFVPTARKVIINNAGSAAIYYGWESTTVRTANEFQGVPLLAGGAVIIDGNPHVGGPLYFDSSAGVLNYTIQS